MDSGTGSGSINKRITLDADTERGLVSKSPSTSIDGGASTTTKRSRESSDVWKFFTKKGIGKDGIERAECKACKVEYKCGGKVYGTSTLKRHIPKCKKIRFHEVGQMLMETDGKLRSKKIDQKLARELLASAVIKHDLPFSFVEYEGIRAWMRYLNPDFIPISRNTLVSDIGKIYLREKENLKCIMSNIPSRICLTSDLWTACTTEGYICLTAHFVDNDWKLNSKILSFAHMPPPHSGVDLASKLLEFLKEWGIEKKVFSLTLDNASSNDNMQDLLKEQLCLHDSLLCEGEFFHVRCSAHILNLIVQEGLKVASAALHKIRESVKYVKGSESRQKKFVECVQEVGNIDTSVGLRLDVSTRWNSTYMMLESALKYKRVFTFLQLNDKNYKYCPSLEEWKRGEKICDFLEPFYETTNLISGSSYPTANLYFMQVWKVEVLLKKYMEGEDEVISDMCRRMKQKFDKYWHQYSMVLAFGAVLDPRIKLSMLEFCYLDVESDPTKCQQKASLVKTKLFSLFEQYSHCNKPSSSQSQSQSHMPMSSTSLTPRNRTSGGGGGSKGKPLAVVNQFKAFASQTVTNTGKSQLELYLDEPRIEFECNEELDVLEFWKGQKHRFPILALMARDVLAIPITTVASESAFSIGARVLTKYRSCTLPEKVQALICSRNWLHGYVVDNEECATIKTTLSKEESNVHLEMIDEQNEEDVTREIGDIERHIDFNDDMEDEF